MTRNKKSFSPLKKRILKLGLTTSDIAIFCGAYPAQVSYWISDRPKKENKLFVSILDLLEWLPRPVVNEYFLQLRKGE